uniref:dihydrofolate reductase n=1 Tax=Haplochromis burtoni TaxID=8153 RepID=A0A3Q2X5E2_HAPBU
MARVLNAIVAVCPDRGIGNKGNLPWHPIRLSKEFAHFRKMTATPSVKGNSSPPCLLPPAGAHYLASDFSSALRLIETELADQADQVWVIGGSSLYKEMMGSTGMRRLFVTQILKQFQCDTFLPEISLDKYRLLPEFPDVPQELQEENGIQYRFEVYESIQE